MAGGSRGLPAMAPEGKGPSAPFQKSLGGFLSAPRGLNGGQPAGRPPWGFRCLVNTAKLSHVWFSFEERWPKQ